HQRPKNGILEKKLKVLKPRPRAAPNTQYDIIVFKSNDRIRHRDVLKNKKVQYRRNYEKIKLPVAANTFRCDSPLAFFALYIRACSLSNACYLQGSAPCIDTNHAKGMR